MASIFLSYARVDASKAEKVAHALEGDGHSVWWDRDLHTGSHFTAEIDEALRAADAVIVLWSANSINSAWVQDEAAAGRDTGRLFPVLLENVAPPLGFRQFQAVDLSGWQGRGGKRALAGLSKSIATRSEPRAAKQDGSPRPRPTRKLAWRWLAAAALVVIVAAAGTIYLLRRGDASPTLAIVAAQTGDTRASRKFAHQVALDFSRFQSSYLGSLAIREDDGSADYTAELGLDTGGEKPSADISVSIGSRGGVKWATTIESDSPRTVDLRQQAAANLSAVIRCAIEADSAKVNLKDADFRLYLDGCTTISNGLLEARALELLPTFRKLTQSYPNFALAHAMLALADYNSFANSPASEWKSLADEGRKALARAKALDPDSEDVIAADSLFKRPNESRWEHAFSILDRGLAIHPNSPLLLNMRAQELMTAGRMGEAATNVRQALQFDPLSPQTRVSLINALVYSNQTAAARRELAEGASIWPNSAIYEDARYRIELRYGNPQTALQLLRAGGATDFSGAADNRSWELFLLARADPTPAKIDSALNSFRERYKRDPADIPGYIQALGTFGRVDEAFDVVRNPVTLDSMLESTDTLFRPHMRSIYSDPRFIGLAQRLGLLSYWQKSGAWPDFCRDAALPYDCRSEAAKYARR